VRRLGLIVLVGLAFAPASAGAAVPRTSLAAVEPQVMCVTCNIPLQVAVSTQADAERAVIVAMINKGETLAQIKRNLVAQYGRGVLTLPIASGFNLVVYIVPVAVVVALLGLLIILLPRWRRRAQPTIALPPELSTSDTARIDAELARFDG
jgi:cytochrome c-type biogenesis protein CcmH